MPNTLMLNANRVRAVSSKHACCYRNCSSKKQHHFRIVNRILTNNIGCDVTIHRSLCTCLRSLLDRRLNSLDTLNCVTFGCVTCMCFVFVINSAWRRTQIGACDWNLLVPFQNGHDGKLLTALYTLFLAFNYNRSLDEVEFIGRNREHRPSLVW